MHNYTRKAGGHISILIPAFSHAKRESLFHMYCICSINRPNRDYVWKYECELHITYPTTSNDAPLILHLFQMKILESRE